MVDVDVGRVAKPCAVVWRNPVAGNDVAADWVYLRAGDAVAFQYLIARIATVAVDVAPMFEERSLVTLWSFVLYADGLQNGKCAATGGSRPNAFRTEIWGNRSGSNGNGDNKRGTMSNNAPLHMFSVPTMSPLVASQGRCLQFR